ETYQTETYQIEEIKEEQAISSPVLEETGASFEIGAEVMSLQEEFIPLVEDLDEPELLITEQQEEEILLAPETTETATDEEESMAEDPAVEIVFDRYALIDSDDSLSQNCINLTNAISTPLYNEEQVSPITLSADLSDEKEMIDTKTETKQVVESKINLQQEEEIRTHLIQVCQKTRKAVGYQLNVLEEIWEASHSSNPTTENYQTPEPTSYRLETSSEEKPVQLDIFSAETKGNERRQREPEEQKTTVDLVAMRQRLSQRFKQLCLKQG
ncbi:hypothetical protein MNBD_PLANCTO02-63, partial [hydrothermal vent metagenome]